MSDLVERLRELTEIKDLAIKDCMAEARENERLHAEIERQRRLEERVANLERVVKDLMTALMSKKKTDE